MDTNQFPPTGFRGGMIQVAGHSDGSNNLLWVIFAVLLVVLLVSLISLVLSEYHRSKEARSPDVAVAQDEAPTAIEAPPGSALALLDTRYASGELGRPDYLQAREDILGSGAPAT